MSSAMPCTGRYSRAASSALAALSASTCAEHDLAQVELLEDGFHVVGELVQAVRAAEAGRLAPAPLGDRDGVPSGQRVYDSVPGLRRSSKVVQEQEGRSRSGATVQGHASAAHVNPGFGT